MLGIMLLLSFWLFFTKGMPKEKSKYIVFPTLIMFYSIFFPMLFSSPRTYAMGVAFPDTVKKMNNIYLSSKKADFLSESVGQLFFEKNEISLKQDGSKYIQIEINKNPKSSLKIFLSLEAHLEHEELAGAAASLELKVNNHIVDGKSLENKNIMFTLKDGRKFSYFDANKRLWELFYTPNYSLNDSDGDSRYHVLEGRATQYTFDITDQINSGNPVTYITLKNEWNYAAAKNPGNQIINIKNIKVISVITASN